MFSIAGVKTYKKKPVEIQAIQLTEENMYDVSDFVGEDAIIDLRDKPSLIIRTLEGEMEAKPSDYIIRGIEGEFYPCKESVFLESYEEVVK